LEHLSLGMIRWSQTLGPNIRLRIWGSGVRIPVGAPIFQRVRASRPVASRRRV